MSLLTPTLGAKNGKRKIENRRKMRKELSSLLTTLTGTYEQHMNFRVG